jgi:hypothetical protein
VDAWPKIEERVFTEALSDPTVAKFKISSEVLKGKIEANRRVLQLRVMKAKFN